MKAANALLKAIADIEQANDQAGVDVIDGVKVRDVVGDVMLDVAFSPVVQHPVGPDIDLDPPQPVGVIELGRGRYGLLHGTGAGADYDSVSAEEVRIMRARFLLLRDHFYRLLQRMPHSTRERVLAWYFPEGVWLPEEGSALAKAMGL